MDPKDDAAGDSRGDGYEPSLCSRIVLALLFPFVSWVVCFYIIAAVLVITMACVTINIDQDYPIACSMELVSFRGLQPALAPGAVSPAFNLLVRVHNGHIYDQYREGGGGVTVSYAGVPLAHGRTPSFRVGAKADVSFTVEATAQAVGVPEELFRLMSAERRWGAAQLEVRMQLGRPGWESFAWSVDLGG
ncbi:hypothetical protein ACP70R_036893 [Stipagrostis hirtigluma subsp. patula]